MENRLDDDIRAAIVRRRLFVELPTTSLVSQVNKVDDGHQAGRQHDVWQAVICIFNDAKIIHRHE